MCMNCICVWLCNVCINFVSILAFIPRYPIIWCDLQMIFACFAYDMFYIFNLFLFSPTLFQHFSTQPSLPSSLLSHGLALPLLPAPVFLPPVRTCARGTWDPEIHLRIHRSKQLLKQLLKQTETPFGTVSSFFPLRLFCLFSTSVSNCQTETMRQERCLKTCELCHMWPFHSERTCEWANVTRYDEIWEIWAAWFEHIRCQTSSCAFASDPQPLIYFAIPWNLTANGILFNSFNIF